MIIDKDPLLSILDYARYAPSVHNTQPWLFKREGNGATIFLNQERRLEAGDPVGRQTWISIGCCVEALVVAACAAGFSTRVELSNENQIKIGFKSSPAVNNHDKSLALAIKDRFTDRSIYSRKAVSTESLEIIRSTSAAKGIKVIVSEDPKLISTVANLTSKGIRLALSNPEFRDELSRFVVPPFKKRGDGIPTRSLRLNTLGGLLELASLRFGLNVKKRAKDEYKTWLSSSALVLVLSQGDTKEYWMNAGRTYMRCALEATGQGLRSATSAAAVEAADFHEDIEKMLGLNQRLQAIIRVGYGQSPPVYSPRLALDKLMLH